MESSCVNIEINLKKYNNYFDKIRGDILTEIFIFLNLSNIRNVMFVCRRFKNQFMKNDSKVLKQIGHLTYGLDKYKDFNKNPLGDINYSKIKSNLHPIEHLVLMNNIDLIASAAGSFNEGVTIWRQSTGVYEYEMKYKNVEGDKGFVTAMLYVEESKYLAVSYLEGEIILYDMLEAFTFKNNKQFNYLDTILWSKKISTNEEPIKKLIYIDSKSLLISLEQSLDHSINFMKAFDLTGTHILSSVISNSTITSLRSFDIIICDEFQSYLIFGLSDGKILLKNFILEDLEKNYTEIKPTSYLYGHEAEIIDTLYILTDDVEVLVSCSRDFYIFYWNVKDPYTQNKVIHISDSLHDDSIVNMSYLERNIFATCGKDRNIILWNAKDYNHIATFSYHTSTINCLAFNSNIRELYSASYDKNIKSVVFSEDYKSVSKLRVINGHLGNITNAKLDFISQVLITASTDKTLKFWDLKNMQFIKSIDTKNEYFDDFIILYDDFNTLVKVDLTKKIKFMNTKTGIIYHFIKESSPARVLLNLYDAVSFLIGLSNSEISYYNYYTFNDRNIFKKKKVLHHSECWGVENKNKSLKIKKLVYIDYIKKIIASGASDGSICIFYLNLNIQKLIMSANGKEVESISNVFCSDEKNVIGFISGEELFLFDLNNMNYVSHLFVGKSSSMDRLNDNYLVLSYNGNHVEIYCTRENKIIRRCECSYSCVKHVIYMRDGDKIVITCGDSGNGYSMDILNFSEKMQIC
jgi:WD40 repeat protein